MSQYKWLGNGPFRSSVLSLPAIGNVRSRERKHGELSFLRATMIENFRSPYFSLVVEKENVRS